MPDTTAPMADRERAEKLARVSAGLAAAAPGISTGIEKTAASLQDRAADQLAELDAVEAADRPGHRTGLIAGAALFGF